MLVKCLYNKGANLPENCIGKLKGYERDSTFDLEINKIYVVYGMVIVEGYIWYYICNRNNCEYPIWKPSSLFEVLDGRMSKCWVFSCLKYNAEDYDTLWAYPEWVNDPYYYDQLTNGEEEYVKNFRKYKVLMDKEFPDPSVQQTAEIGDEKWLICPKCVDAWESSTIEDAMVTCPMCKTIYHNPRYKNDDSYQFKVVNMNH